MGSLIEWGNLLTGSLMIESLVNTDHWGKESLIKGVLCFLMFSHCLWSASLFINGNSSSNNYHCQLLQQLQSTVHPFIEK